MYIVKNDDDFAVAGGGVGAGVGAGAGLVIGTDAVCFGAGAGAGAGATVTLAGTIEGFAGVLALDLMTAPRAWRTMNASMSSIYLCQT